MVQLYILFAASRFVSKACKLDVDALPLALIDYSIVFLGELSVLSALQNFKMSPDVTVALCDNLLVTIRKHRI